MIAKTLMGLEPLVVEELEAIGAKNIEEQKRAVYFEGDLEILYKANLYLRCALTVLVPIHTFKAKNERRLYEGVQDFDWLSIIDIEQTFAFRSTVNSDFFDHSQYVSLKAKDAIVDQFRDRLGKRPNIDKDHADIPLNIHINHDQVSISLDSSGLSLNKRGYRSKTFGAPLNECLAAAMIKMSGWQGEKPFIDPMCGSGTLAIEAALIATHTAPGLLRKAFAFENWKDFDAELWKQLKEEAKTKIVTPEYEIWASDRDGRAIDTAKSSVLNIKLDRVIKVEKKPFEELQHKFDSAVIMINPPYDERIELDDPVEFYKMIGNTLKKNHSGCLAWIISSNIDALKHVGLKTSRRIHLKNGPLDCKFHSYDLYDGSKKNKPKKPRRKIRIKSDGSIERVDK